MSTEAAEPGTSTPSELAQAQRELLWGEYTELRTHQRHAETVRTNAVTFVLLLTSALITVITLDKEISGQDWVLGLIIAIVGFFSTAFSILYVERYEKHRAQAECVRDELDRLFFNKKGLGKSLSDLRRAGAQQLQEDVEKPALKLKAAAFRRVRKVAGGPHVFWVLMPMLVSGMGLTVTLISAF